MTRRLLVTSCVLGIIGAGVVNGQDRAASTPPDEPRPVSKTAAPTVKAQIVLARYADDKRIASQPYELLLVADGMHKILRTGAEVPLSTAVVTAGDEKQGYKSIGTQVICDVTLYSDGRFRTQLTVHSSSVYPNETKQADRSAFRTYALSGAAFLRDGQTTEIASATDSLTGEIIKAEITVSVVK